MKDAEPILDPGNKIGCGIGVFIGSLPLSAFGAWIGLFGSGFMESWGDWLGLWLLAFVLMLPSVFSCAWIVRGIRQKRAGLLRNGRRSRTTPP